MNYLQSILIATATVAALAIVTVQNINARLADDHASCVRVQSKACKLALDGLFKQISEEK
jgi:hypothetical protein